MQFENQTDMTTQNCQNSQHEASSQCVQHKLPSWHQTTTRRTRKSTRTMMMIKATRAQTLCCHGVAFLINVVRRLCARPCSTLTCAAGLSPPPRPDQASPRACRHLVWSCARASRLPRAHLTLQHPLFSQAVRQGLPQLSWLFFMQALIRKPKNKHLKP